MSDYPIPDTDLFVGYVHFAQDGVDIKVNSLQNAACKHKQLAHNKSDDSDCVHGDATGRSEPCGCPNAVREAGSSQARKRSYLVRYQVDATK